MTPSKKPRLNSLKINIAARALFNLYWEAQHIRRVRQLEWLRARLTKHHRKNKL